MSGQDRSGSVFDRRYRLEQLIGRGASAEVYRATDVKTQAAVAVKILLGGFDSSEELRRRFAREAEVQAMVRHRNVATLFASGITARREPYLIMELLRGKTLRGTLRQEGAVSQLRAASYTWQALQGLTAVHAAGVLHRDLKPANIMLEPSPGPIEHVVLIDFGFAALEGGPALTQRGSVVGSMTYMAPERVRQDTVDARCDVYAMGVILFELLTGHPPFQADNDIELVRLHVNQPAPPAMVQGSLSPLAEVVATALAKTPSERFATAAAMANALEQCAQRLPAQ